MVCPACDRTLTEKTVGDLVVDVCDDGCGGIWFDRRELQKVDEQHESGGAALLDVHADPAVKVDHSKRRSCPRCDRTVLMRRLFSPQSGVEVDECPGCAGFWLDLGELGGLRSEFETVGDRERAERQHISETFVPQLAEMQAESIAAHTTFQRLMKILRLRHY
ncbi:MAG: zf-TFIIB domain-containing protein [Armatimonadota bacterium]